MRSPLLNMTCILVIIEDIIGAPVLKNTSIFL